MEGRPKRWTEQQETRFEGLWKVYPPRNGVKSDKGGARKEFLALNPSESSCKKILAAIEARKKTWEWSKENGTFVPDFRKYLKHRMWEDDVEPEPENMKPIQCKNCGYNKTQHDLRKFWSAEEWKRQVMPEGVCREWQAAGPEQGRREGGE